MEGREGAISRPPAEAAHDPDQPGADGALPRVVEPGAVGHRLGPPTEREPQLILLVEPCEVDIDECAIAVSGPDVCTPRLEAQEVAALEQAPPGSIFVADAWETSGNLAGRILFGPDNKLYITVGDRDRLCCIGKDDYSLRMKAQALDNHVGKTLRLRDDGSVPPDNPFVGRSDASPEVFTYGHRNGYGLTIHPETGEKVLFVNANFTSHVVELSRRESTHPRAEGRPAAPTSTKDQYPSGRGAGGGAPPGEGAGAEQGGSGHRRPGEHRGSRATRSEASMASRQSP